MKRDFRGSLAAKCGAIALLFAAAAGALVCWGVVIAQSFGYGVYSFTEDPILLDSMDGAMQSAMYNVFEPSSYRTNQLRSRYGGFSALVYSGTDPAEENLAGTWSEVPDDVWLQRTNTYEISDGYATVVGYLSDTLHPGSVFYREFQFYNFLHSFHYASTVLLAVLLTAACLVLLVFLLCAAGHRAGKTGIYPNWQDRVPLDLYLCCVLFASAMILLLADQAGNTWNSSAPLLMLAAPLTLAFLSAGTVVLAALLTLATRLKLGRWWRNTVCWKLFRWYRKLWRQFWDVFMDFVHLLPLTWKSILIVGGVLGIQSFLTLLMFETYEGAVFFLFALLLDAILIVSAVWLTRQLQIVKDMGIALAAGDLEAKLDTSKLYWDIKTHAKCLNAIGEGMNEAVERRMRSERLKTELITNVSHDIKTPLTSIVNYVDLLKKEELPPAAAEYVAVLDRQSNKLKKLTEDLVEASKASTGNISVHLEPIVVNEIIHQAVGDYDERLAAGKLDVVVNTYEGNLIALTDGRLLWRVLDNLLSNVCKYAMAGTRVYVDLGTRDGAVLLTMKNISRDPLNINADELMERFVRGDTSRHTEGSGLGLNIARSLMDLMGGSFSLSVDGDLFKAELTLKMVEQKPWEKPIKLVLPDNFEDKKSA